MAFRCLVRAPDSLKDWPQRVQRYGRSSVRDKEEGKRYVKIVSIKSRDEFRCSDCTSVTAIVTNQGAFCMEGGPTQVT